MIQTINMRIPQDPWALGHGIVQGKFQRKCRCCHVDGLNLTYQYLITVYGPVYCRVYGPVYDPVYGPDGLNQTDQYLITV